MEKSGALVCSQQAAKGELWEGFRLQNGRDNWLCRIASPARQQCQPNICHCLYCHLYNASDHVDHAMSLWCLSRVVFNF